MGEGEGREEIKKDPLSASIKSSGDGIMSNKEPQPPSFGIGHLLFAVFLAVIFFVLGESMVRHLTGHPHHTRSSRPK